MGEGSPKNGGGGSNGGGSGRNKKTFSKVDATEGPARVRARYDAHLPSLFLRYGENSRTIMSGAILPTLHSHVLCKNWHLCQV